MSLLSEQMHSDTLCFTIPFYNLNFRNIRHFASKNQLYHSISAQVLCYCASHTSQTKGDDRTTVSNPFALQHNGHQ
ncbi:hypothetical protein PsorP6_004829 [Peronosclerospora sorghi]|uniref:Uncharacterized protein n=1 Tax=Peronosclerospora sorghi TaxID=230839 RepID=A0ACC0VNZ3_9STRA|nr:hypothetical protein PsorP6_004829 [Peronosclerospora sorghi]